MKRKPFTKKKAILAGLLVAGIFLFIGSVYIYAADDGAIAMVLLENKDIFVCNDIFQTVFRQGGWLILTLLAKLGASCAELFDNAFRFVDFTQIPEVEQFINSFKPVFIALICLSLIALGSILIFWHEKKPKLAMNICLAVLVVSSGSYLIRELNHFLADDMRGAIVSGDANASTDMVYNIVGTSITDLAYLDSQIGLMYVTKENRVTYPNMTQQDMELIDINEIIKPDDVQDGSKDLMGKRIVYVYGGVSVEEIYNGVAWTDLLNAYYYRYNVSWFTCIVSLLSIALIYICLAYKVVRILYEIVIHQLLAYLYSANLSNSQKTLKVLEGIKDSYITLILIMVCVKIYTLAYYFISSMSVGGFTKALLLLFVAFAVSDGPNIIQKLTGIDAGLSSGIGKIIAASQAARAAGSVMEAAAHGIAGVAHHVSDTVRNMRTGSSMGAAGDAFEPTEDYRNSEPMIEDTLGMGENPDIIYGTQTREVQEIGMHSMQEAHSDTGQASGTVQEGEPGAGQASGTVQEGEPGAGQASGTVQEGGPGAGQASDIVQEGDSDTGLDPDTAQESSSDVGQASGSVQEDRFGAGTFSDITQEGRVDVEQASDTIQESSLDMGQAFAVSAGNNGFVAGRTEESAIRENELQESSLDAFDTLDGEQDTVSDPLKNTEKGISADTLEGGSMENGGNLGFSGYPSENGEVQKPVGNSGNMLDGIDPLGKGYQTAGRSERMEKDLENLSYDRNSPGSLQERDALPRHEGQLLHDIGQEQLEGISYHEESEMQSMVPEAGVPLPQYGGQLQHGAGLEQGFSSFAGEEKQRITANGEMEALKNTGQEQLEGVAFHEAPPTQLPVTDSSIPQNGKQLQYENGQEQMSGQKRPPFEDVEEQMATPEKGEKQPVQKEMSGHEVFDDTGDQVRNEGLETRIPH